MSAVARDELDRDLTLTSARLAAIRFRSVLSLRTDSGDGPLLLADVPQWANQLASLGPAARAELAQMIADPARCISELDRRAMATLSGLDMSTRRKLAAIVAESPTSTLANDVAGFLSATFGPPPAAQRTDARSTSAHGCDHCDVAGCTGCTRTDWQPGDEGIDDMSADEKLTRAHRAGRREADRALRRVLAEESGTVDPDDDESGTSDEDELDDPDATQTRNDSDHGDSHMPTRRDDIHALSNPRSPGEFRAAKERFSRSVDDEVRADHRSDAADREHERLLDSDPILYQEPAIESAARDAARRRAHAVGRSDARDAGTSPSTFHLAQRRRFHLPPDGGNGNEAA